MVLYTAANEPELSEWIKYGTTMTSLLLRSSLAALLLTPRLFRAPIDPALIPQGAPALFAGTQLGVLH
jgi:hypothetical protein